MEVLVSMALCLIIALPRLIGKDPIEVVNVTEPDCDSGYDYNIVEDETTTTVYSTAVGTNVFLKREPRAFHKILDEMGL